MKDTKPNNNKIKKNTATMPTSQKSPVSGLFSGIAISCFFGGGGGYTTVFFGIIDAEDSTNDKTDNCAYKDADNKL